MKLSVFNLNGWLFHSWSRKSKDNGLRFDILATYLSRLKPDFITLQEFWSQSYVKRLAKALRTYHVAKSDSPFYFNKSGLVTLSAFEPESVKCSIFPITDNHNRHERLGKKGFIQTKYVLGDEVISLFNTHLYSPENQTEEEINLDQFEKIKRAADKCDISIIAGDLNMPLEKILEVNGGYQHSGNEDHTFCPTNPYVSNNEKGKKIDYVLTKSQRELSLSIDTKRVTRPVMSDHYALSAEIMYDDL